MFLKAPDIHNGMGGISLSLKCGYRSKKQTLLSKVKEIKPKFTIFLLKMCLLTAVKILYHSVESFLVVGRYFCMDYTIVYSSPPRDQTFNTSPLLSSNGIF